MDASPPSSAQAIFANTRVGKRPPSVRIRRVVRRRRWWRTLIIPTVGTFEIREYDQGWPDAFRDAASLGRRASGE